MLVYCFARSYTYQETAISCILCPRESRLTNHTIEYWFDLFRDRLIDHVTEMIEGGDMIDGPGTVVQIDEAQIGRRKYNRGRVPRETWVLSMVGSNGQVRMEICEDRSARILIPLIQKHVALGSTIQTDSWRAYS